jgi:hypothetical protein
MEGCLSFRRMSRPVPEPPISAPPSGDSPSDPLLSQRADRDRTDALRAHRIGRCGFGQFLLPLLPLHHPRPEGICRSGGVCDTGMSKTDRNRPRLLEPATPSRPTPPSRSQLRLREASARPPRLRPLIPYCKVFFTL